MTFLSLCIVGIFNRERGYKKRWKTKNATRKNTSFLLEVSPQFHVIILSDHFFLIRLFYNRNNEYVHISNLIILVQIWIVLKRLIQTFAELNNGYF